MNFKFDGTNTSKLSVVLCEKILKKSVEISKLPGAEPVTLVTNKGRLLWFGHVEHRTGEKWAT